MTRRADTATDLAHAIDDLRAVARRGHELDRRANSPGGHHDGYPAGTDGGPGGGGIARPTEQAAIAGMGRTEPDPVAAWANEAPQLVAWIEDACLRLRNLAEAIPSGGEHTCPVCERPLGTGRVRNGRHNACDERLRRAS